jgi:hypothetical protein
MFSKTSRTTAVGVATTAILAVGGMLALDGAASAHNPPGTANDPKLVKFTQGAAEVGYSSIRNAPGSPQANALRFETTGDGTGAQVRALNIGALGDAIGDVDRLSLKARHSEDPQLVVQLSNGHWLHFKTGENCAGGVDFGSGWFRYNFSTSDTCEVVATAPDVAPVTYATYADAVAGEGAGNTISKIRVIQNNADGTGWVDDIRLGSVLFAGPDVNTHSH